VIGDLIAGIVGSFIPLKAWPWILAVAGGFALIIYMG